MNINYYVTSNQIQLFWDCDCFGDGEYTYIVYANGLVFGKTDKTHFNLSGLSSETEYSIKIEVYNNENKITSYEQVISTLKEKNKIDVTKSPYKAVGDGLFLNTEALQTAIDNCTKNDYVYIPKGTFLTGALKLHSDTEIYLDEGAVLQGTYNRNDYLPLINSRFEGIERKCYSALINIGELNNAEGITCENIHIHGKGSILGGGRSLAEDIINFEKNQPGYSELCAKEHYDDGDVLAGRIRPRLINISNCKNVIINGLTIGNGPSWNIHMVYSENMVTNACKIVSKGVWNGDGWDPDSSKNCVIFDCIFESGDDCIAIKSGKNPEGNIINRPCENIFIFDCRAIEGLGGIAVGSEMSGGIKNIRIWDCDFEKVRCGIQVKATKKRGGYVKNIVAKRCRIPSILLHSVWYNDDGLGADEAPIFKDFFFENIEITGKAYVKPAPKTFEGIPDDVDYCSIDIAGFDSEKHAAENIRFKDIKIKQNEYESQKVLLKFCKGIHFENISCV